MRANMLVNEEFTRGGAVDGAHLSMEDLDKRALRRLLTVLERFRKVRQTMPVHLVSALLRVAVNEGRSVIWYARDSEVSQSVMSRHLLELGSQYVKGEPGLGLVEKRTSPNSLREQEVYLTAKGRKAVQEVVNILAHGKANGDVE